MGEGREATTRREIASILTPKLHRRRRGLGAGTVTAPE